MRRIKTIFCSLLMLISIMAVPCTTYAYTITASAPSISIDAEIARADVIVMKLRYKGDVLQCRRWNETQGCWVDPYWMDVK